MDVTELAPAIAEIVREYVTEQLGKQQAEIVRLTGENDDLRAKNAEFVQKFTILEEKIAAFPTPKDGADGQNGASGEKGADGKDGRDGRDGRDGKDGEAGRDALQIDILPAIDQSKSYLRGTYASHNGGLWRAKQATNGMEGWELICDGIQAIDFILSDERKAAVLVTRANGKTTEMPFTIPSLIYRGVFSEKQAYELGDMVTFGGGVWHCDGAPEGKPGEAKGWTLAVKKGRDGRDGAKGERGEKGEKGRDGRDLTQMDGEGRKW